jgi:hypothetical protein
MKEIITILECNIHNPESTFNNFSVEHFNALEIDKYHGSLFDNPNTMDRIMLVELPMLEKSFFWYQRILSVKDKLLNIRNEYNKVKDEINFTFSILDNFKNTSAFKGIKNPIENITKQNLRELQARMKELDQPILILFTRQEAHLIQIDSSAKKTMVAQIIFDIARNEIIDEVEEIDLDNLLTQSNQKLLHDLNIPIFEKIKEYNTELYSRIISDLLDENWDIDYTIIYEISNAKQVISEDESLMKINDDSSYKVKKNSIEIHLNTFEDLTGSDVDPLEPNFKTQLQDKVEEIAWDNVSLDYENDIIQILGDLAENTEIKIRNAEFPKMEELIELKEKLDSLKGFN